MFGNMRVQKTFLSVAEYVRYLESAKTVGYFNHYPLASKQKDSRGWYGTDSWNDAQGLLTFGDRKSFDLLSKEVSKVGALTTTGGQLVRREVYSSVVGGCPNVGNALSGSPLVMINIRKVMKNSPKVLNFVYNPSVHSGIASQDLAKAGAKVLKAVCDAERQGYMVNLYTIMATCAKDDTLCALVRIKSSSERINVLRCAYPMVNPSWFRRHFLRFVEVEATNERFTNGYGIPKTNIDLVSGIKVDKYMTAIELIK